jgi:hypothetical protein
VAVYREGTWSGDASVPKSTIPCLMTPISRELRLLAGYGDVALSAAIREIQLVR